MHSAEAIVASTSSSLPEMNQWLTVQDYARKHGVSRQTVWNWILKQAVEVSRKAPRTGVRVRDRSA